MKYKKEGDIVKIYCSFDENDILTGWTSIEGCFTTNETFREIDISEEEFETLQNSHPNCFKFENGILVDRKQEFIDEIKLLKMEKMAVLEEQKAEELRTALNRLNI